MIFIVTFKIWLLTNQDLSITRKKVFVFESIKDAIVQLSNYKPAEITDKCGFEIDGFEIKYSDIK